VKPIAWPGLIALSLTLSGCNDPPATPPAAPAPTATRPATPPATTGQRGGGLPYEITGSEVWDVPDPVSKRDYQIFVTLPPSYADNPGRRYPVLYVTDADYAFPIIRQLARRLNIDKPVVDEFILVGLSYAKGNGGMESRRRDYTPTAAGAPGTPAGTVHGGGDAYVAYLRDQVMPAVAKRYRTDEANRLFLGHSYGSLLGLQIMFSQPELFSGYILGSPSLWYDNHVMAETEAAYAAAHKDLPARAYMFVGEYEDMRPGDPRYATRYNMVSDARTLDKTLKARRYPSLDLSLEVLNDEDHLSVAPRGFTHGLKHLLPAEPS
jgi:predicted alpha/beta superfamily hydrolase